jgi:hypothetical protein
LSYRLSGCVSWPSATHYLSYFSHRQSSVCL